MKPAAFLPILAIAAGCASPYVASEAVNPVSTGAYTRAETIGAEQRLVAKLLADPAFASHYAAKAAQRGGAPALQVAHIDNLTTRRVGTTLAAVRRDLETALRSSGRFLLSGDIDACDYILHGEYRDIADGRRITHQLALRLHDTAADLDVWTGSDEIAKE